MKDDEATPSFFCLIYIYMILFFFHYGFRWYRWKPQTQGHMRHQVASLSKYTTQNYWLMLKRFRIFLCLFVCLFVLLMSTWFTSSFCSPHVPHTVVTKSLYCLCASSSIIKALAKPSSLPPPASFLLLFSSFLLLRCMFSVPVCCYCCCNITP